MRSRVELFEQIRLDHEVEALSIRALAERHGVGLNRRTVTRLLASDEPPNYHRAPVNDRCGRDLAA